ncbi:GIY-YIG nuclease family protein [Candidatus Peregrinibacteria bacterium]|nr:GIY-YIG nuclease family protein [Candidatus Peregrinibacteria bacterium]
MKTYFVYIITNFTHSTLYIGITNNLERRIYEHKTGIFEGFSKKYHLKYLVYCEETSDVMSAIEREKQLKKWKRSWKDKLIEDFNPMWQDLSSETNK